MFQVYTQQRGAELTKTLVKELKPELKYIIEETTGHFNSYGELLVDVVAESD